MSKWPWNLVAGLPHTTTWNIFANSWTVKLLQHINHISSCICFSGGKIFRILEWQFNYIIEIEQYCSMYIIWSINIIFNTCSSSTSCHHQHTALCMVWSPASSPNQEGPGTTWRANSITHTITKTNTNNNTNTNTNTNTKTKTQTKTKTKT